jgi:hypothetical protein
MPDFDDRAKACTIARGVAMDAGGAAAARRREQRA